jgi:imidazolonepropionase-like amidohydrolase
VFPLRRLTVACIALTAAIAVVSQTEPQRRIVLETSTLLDGKGGVLHDQRIVIDHGRIVSIGPAAGDRKGRVDYDLSNLTVLPGLIDTHVHLQWHMDAHHKAVAGGGNVDPQEMVLYDAADAWLALDGGFTTVQSVGSPFDAPVRDRIKEGVLPGPRVLTSLIQIQGTRASDKHVYTTDELRATVRKTKADGADVIKLFATTGLGAGGNQSMTDEQIQAVCSEAKAVGLRSVVHAIGDAGARASVLAGCTAIEHGTFLKNETLDLMVQHGTFFDPNLIVLHNYLENRDSYTFTDAQLATIEAGIAPTEDVLRRARARGVKIAFGTDAVAGAHGRNAEELVYRVKDAGETPMNAIESATSVSAADLGLGDRIGTLAVGFNADLIAIEGDPLKDITAVRHVVFVMKDGKVFKNVAHPQSALAK